MAVLLLPITTALCYHHDQTVCRWMYNDMRKHLAQYLEAEDPFPAAEDITNRAKTKNVLSASALDMLEKAQKEPEDEAV